MTKKERKIIENTRGIIENIYHYHNKNLTQQQYTDLASVLTSLETVLNSKTATYRTYNMKKAPDVEALMKDMDEKYSKYMIMSNNDTFAYTYDQISEARDAWLAAQQKYKEAIK